jgi:tetratricopeptide (TPR) repeat protein
MDKKEYISRLTLVAIGLLMGFLILEAALQLAGFIIYSAAIGGKAGTYTIMTVGESTTANLLNGQGSWPEELQKILDARYGTGNIKVKNTAVPGTNSNLIRLRLERNLDLHSPDMVIAMIGINDDELSPMANDLSYDRSFFKTPGFLMYICRSAGIKMAEYGLDIKYFFSDSDIERSKVAAAVGSLYYEAKRYDYAETKLLEAIELDPSNPIPYILLEEIYLYEARVDDHEKLFSSAVESNGETDWILVAQGRMHFYNLEYDEAQREFGQAMAMNQNSSAGFWLALVAYATGNFSGTVDLLNAYDVISDDPNIYVMLGKAYFELKEYGKALEAFEKVEISKHDEVWPYLTRIHLFLSQESPVEADKGPSPGIFKMQKENFEKIYGLVSRRNITLFIMQYPTLEVEPLADIWGGHDDIVYISNTGFSQMVEQEGYQTFFTDHFGNTFGHATLRGNKEIAKNAAVAITPILDKRLQVTR